MVSFVNRTLWLLQSPMQLKLWPRSYCLNLAATFLKTSGSAGPTLHGIKSLSSVRSITIQGYQQSRQLAFCTIGDPSWTAIRTGYSYSNLIKKDGLKCLMMHTTLRALGGSCWHFDSGSSVHVANDRTLFATFEEDSDDESVSFGDGGECRIHGRGEIKFPGVGELKNVLCVEDSDSNLLSISQICDDGFEVNFTQQGCFVTNKQGECVLKGIRTFRDIYVIQPYPLFLMVPTGFLVAEGEEEVSLVQLTTATMEEEEEEEELEVEPKDDNSTITNDVYYDLLTIEGKKLVLKKKIKKGDICPPCEGGDLLSPGDAICFGSSLGWLAFIHPGNCLTYLYNPLIINPSTPFISLPPIKNLPSEHLSEDFFKKIVSSSLPPYDKNNSKDYWIVMAIQGYQSYELAFCRIDHPSWTALHGTLGPYRDLVYSVEHQLFFALGCCGLEAWDFRNPASPTSTFITESMPPTMSLVSKVVECCCSRRYLVESSGDLLVVNRYSSSAICSKTVAFDVYKLDFVGKEWVYLPSLGDRVVFVGANHAESFSVYGLFPGLIPNSIYFTACDTSISNDLGFFNLEDKSIYRRHLGKKKVQPSPTWMVPQL
ncbi:uncharacterized protein LOC132312995 [Cornus florida]|uniref:uncharacterized protein LOC132312995 n=1 Tax=Cornus florida TaxID=4283 RepID=UPI00289CD8E8|nr:uncharacterized protein LOC132312995 [Cornus florida]